MTSFLFIPSTTAGLPAARRVDLARLAAQFAEVEEPAPRAASGQLTRLALMLLILFGVIGDTMLVTRPAAVANAIATGHPAPTQPLPRTSL
jgi:hypothetical protein